MADRTYSVDELTSMIAPQWRKDFEHFIETGDASDAFRKYMDSDARCQEAVERAFEIKTAGLEALAEALAGDSLATDAASTNSDDWVPLALAIERVASLSQGARQCVARHLKARVAPHQRKDLASMLDD